MRNSSRRWKENRVREEIYKQSFKDIKASSDGAAAESQQEFQPPSNETYKYQADSLGNMEESYRRATLAL